MSKLDNGRRLGEGLPASRKRYIERAETLLQDREFEGVIREMRRNWNAVYPAYAITRAADMGAHFPASLQAELRQYGLDKNPFADPPADPRAQERFFTAWWAALKWTVGHYLMCERYFPRSNYEPPRDPRMGRPEAEFILAAIGANLLRDLEGHAVDYFPPFELRYYSPASSLMILQALRDPELERRLVEGLAPYFPFGVTAHDIQRAAPSLAQQKNDFAPHRTSWNRVRAALAEGTPVTVVAKRFGIPLKTLRGALKRRGSVS